MMINDLNNKLHKLFSLHRFGIKPGLERIFAILNEVDNPHNKIKTIHVAGTNGKGSVSSYIASILQSAGYKVGLFTSPHIKNFNERIKINGIDILNRELDELIDIFVPISEKINATFFEINTAMALKYFADKNVDIAIVETGMGGRYDSTNVINPLLSIITNIDIDHSEYLGDTLEKIALEKAGIIKENSILICGEKREEIKRLFKEISENKNTQYYFPLDNSAIDNVEFSDSFYAKYDLKLTEDNIVLKNILIPLIGYIQINNSILAIQACLALRNLGYEISDAHILIGLNNVKVNIGLFGRIELLKKNPPLIIDVSHNSAGIKAMVNAIAKTAFSSKKWNIIIGMMADKDIKAALSELKPICKDLYCISPKIERAINYVKLAQLAKELGFDSVHEFKSIEQAINHSQKTNEPTIICGSFYVVEEALEALKK